MSLHSGAHLFDLLGVSMLDDRLAALLAELAAATPPVALDREAVVTAPAAGLDIVFKPQAWFDNGRALATSPQDMLTSLFSFHADGRDGRRGYAGELPFGLRFEMSMNEVKAVLDPLGHRSVDRWKIDRRYVHVDWAGGWESIGRLTIGLRCSVPAHGEPTRMRPATVDLVRRLAARIPGSPRDHTAVDDIPEELAALRREAAGHDTPFFADESLLGSHAITLADSPPDVESLLESEDGPGYARFFEDVRWIGKDDQGNRFGYWKAGADTFGQAPVLLVDDEASFYIESLCLVDHFANVIGHDAPALVDFCRRAGRPMPRSLNEREFIKITAGIPEPEPVLYAIMDLESNAGSWAVRADG
jgi:hypothetical protein